MSPGLERARAAWPALLATALATAVFAARAAPGVTFEDSGELAAAAATLGVPHPPGYPLLMLLGRAWIALASPLVADPARAMNLFSAMCAGAACGAVSLFALRHGASALAALAAGLFLACSETFAAQAVVTEVYALAGLTQALLALVALCSARPALWTGVWLGLALCSHFGSLLLMPLALHAVVREARSARDARASTSWMRAALRLAGGWLLGLAPFLYVPLAAARDPAINWGEATSWARFLEHLTRGQYSANGVHEWKAVAGFLAEQTWLVWQPAVWLLALPLVWKREDRRGLPWLALVAALATCLAGLAISLHYPIEPESKARLAGSCAVLSVVAALLMALVLAGLERWAIGHGRRTLALAAPLVLIVLAPWHAPTTLAPAVNAREHGEASAYASEVLSECPPGAVLVVSNPSLSDVLYFPLLYRQVVRCERSDVLLLNRGLLELRWYREQLARREPQFAELAAELERAFAGRTDLAASADGRRALTSTFLQALCDGERPVVAPHQPGPQLAGDREVLPGRSLWHVLPRVEARGPGFAAPILSSEAGGWAFLGVEPSPRGELPWLARLRELARERDLARAGLLRATGADAAADALAARWVGSR